MKRLALVSILVSGGAYAACTVEEPVPPNETLTGGTAPVGGASGTDQGGASGTGVGGTTGGTVPNGGTTGGTVPNGGTTGGTITGGTGGSPPTGGTGGSPPTGGTGGMMGGTAGMMMGGQGGTMMGGTGGSMMGGMAGMIMGGTGGTMPEDLSKVGMNIHGHTILMPCNGMPTGRVCTPVPDNTRPCVNPAGGPAASYATPHSHNEQVMVGGTPGVRYILRVRIQGEVEAKTYTGGTDANNSATLPANGLYTGGVANNSSNQYNIYFIRTDSPPQHYYLNSVGTSSDNRIRHSTFPMDYEFDMPVDGGSTVCLVSADPNNSAIKNCAEPDNGSNCTGTNTVTVANLAAPTLADIGGTQPYNGQFVGVTVVNTTRMP